MNKLAAQMKVLWEKTAPRNAHLGVSGERDMLLDRFKALVTDKMNVSGKVVVDFGIGGGLLGVHLLTHFRPKMYVGYDIADRSIATAKKNLEQWTNVKLIQIKEHRWSFADERPDIVVCLACIIHFPNKTYLDNVLKELNVSSAKKLVLEVRDRGRGPTWFLPKAYSSPKGPITTCECTEAYVSSILSSYTLKEKTDPSKERGLQVLWYSKRRDT